MKILATVLDTILWLTFAYYAFTTENFRQSENMGAALLFGLLLIINIIAIWHNRIVVSDTWLGLYIRRKKAEERARLSKLG